MAGCASCAALRANAPNFILNGVTNTECSSLKNNTGLNPNLSVLHNNCEDLQDVNACINSSLLSQLKALDMCKPADLKAWLTAAVNNFTVVGDAIICSDCGAWIEIGKIWDAIDEIASGGSSYRVLVRGTDYNWTWQNNWYQQYGNYPAIRYYETSEHVKQIVILTSGSGDTSLNSQLQHDNLNNTVISHGSLDDTGYQLACCLFSFTFTGAYTFLNTGNLVLQEASLSSNIMNNRPTTVALRTAWPVGYNVTRNPAWGTGDVYYLHQNTLQDGLNMQWTTYGISDLRCSSANIGYGLTYYI